ncbi:MAG: hypothetical protein AAF405_07335 [Pseudomonadota bacterium]
MLTEVFKQLSLSVFGLVLGLAVLAANSNPAFADRGKNRIIDNNSHYASGAQLNQKSTKGAQRHRTERKFGATLDFETQAVWRNLRPSWYTN